MGDVISSPVYDLIIFDCDGTLVDSEYLNNKVVADLLAGAGLPQYDVHTVLNRFVGMTVSGIREIIESETGKPMPDVFGDYTRLVNEAMPAQLKLIEGVLETLHDLHSRIKICVGSNGERSNVLQSLELAGLKPYLPDPHVFTKNMVKHGKPAPDLFLYAAEKMGAMPARTLVIEDSVTGARAGKAAGMTVVGFTATFHDQGAQGAALRASGVDYVTNHFADIADLLSQTAA